MNEDILKDICLCNELETAIRLIELGFGEFQNLQDDFYYLPFQLLSSGFERLMKCHICLGYHKQHMKYPDNKYLKGCGGRGGHDLLELKKSILESYFSTHTIPVLQEDFELIKNDKDLELLLHLLSEFGKYSRYYNLDVITSAPKQSADVKKLWEDYETSLVTSNEKMMEKFDDLEKSCSPEIWKEAYDYAKRQILIKLEKFTRSICRQFTIGRLGKKALQYSIALNNFTYLKDEELGDRNYRIKITRYKEEDRKVHARTPLDEIQRRTNSRYRHAVIRKKEFEGDWPFYHDEVTIECREKYWCVVTIENKDYALNGSAQGRYKLENVHDAGMAVVGKSIGPFIDMALQLGKEL
jgi:hypothetical protein